MEQKNTNKKNKVKMTNKKHPVVVSNNEDGNKKIVIASLILAVLIGTLIYFQLSNNNKLADKKTDKKEEVEEKTNTEDVIIDDEIESETVEHIKTVVEKVKSAIKEKEEEEERESQITYYAITFNVNGGEKLDKQILTPDEQTYNVTPVREGWIFDSWYLDEELTEKYEFGSNLSEDVTLYAKWVKKVNFIHNQQIVDTKYIGEDEIVELLSKDELLEENADDFEVAWMFNEKDSDGNLVTKEVTEGTLLKDIKTDKDVIDLISQKLDKFVLKFYLSEDDSEPIHEQTVVEKRVVSFDEANAKVKELTDMLDNYGWYYRDESMQKWNFAAKMVANKEITELFLDEAYIVTFEEIEDEEEVILEEQKVVKDSKMPDDSIPVPEEKEGYDFGGWIVRGDEENASVLDENTIIDEDKVFIPKWIEKPDELNDLEQEEVLTQEPLNNDDEETLETNTQIEENSDEEYQNQETDNVESEETIVSDDKPQE